MNRGGKQKRMTTKRVLAVWLAALVVILALIWYMCTRDRVYRAGG